MEEWLIVDGYNVIGAHGVWSTLSLGEARDILLATVTEYEVVTGRKVTLVFDAHKSPGAQVKEEYRNVTVWYTKEHESADHLIERLVRNHKKSGRRIYVATSDYLEQRMVFGQGAFRLSSRELIHELETMKRTINQQIEREQQAKARLGQTLDATLLETLEKWRRKK